MLDRLLRGGQITALLALALLSILLVSGSATTRTTFEIVDGEVSYLVTGHAGEVDCALEYAGVSLSGADRIAISQENDVVRVTVQRPVTHFERTTTRILPFAQLREEDPEPPIGEERVVQKGVDGSVEHTVKVVTDPDGTVHRYDLGEHVARHVAPRELPRRGEGQRDRRIEVCAAVRTGDHYSGEDGHRPGDDDDDPPRAVAFGAGQ